MSPEVKVLGELAPAIRSLLAQVELRLNGEGDDKQLLAAAEDLGPLVDGLEAILKLAARDQR